MSLTIRGRGPWADRLLLGGVGVAVLVFAVHRLFAFDVFWQIRAGEWIASHGIPRVDPFSYGFPGREWIEPRWLWCVLVHAIYESLGVNFLILIKALALCGVFGLLAACGGRQPRWAVAMGAALALVAGHERFMVRPELISFLGLSATLLCLERFRDSMRPIWIWPLPLLQILWCNAHTLWILGPVALWIVLAGELVQGPLARRLGLFSRGGRLHGPALRHLAAVATAASLAALVNPYGLRGVAFPFQLFRELRGDHVFSETIAEFRGPFSAAVAAWDFRTVGLATVIAISAASFLLRRRSLVASRLALWSAFLFLALEAQRNAALFGLVAGYATMLNLGQASRDPGRRATLGLVRAAARAAVAAFVVVAVPLVVTDRFYRWQGSHKRFGFGVSDHRFPIRALAFVRQAGLPTPVLHALGDGGYVLFEGGPGSAYADGRLEVYGAENLVRAFRVTWTGEGLDEEAARTGVRTVLVRNEEGYRPLLRHLEGSGGWKPVYFDPLHLIYLRDGPDTRELIERYAFEWSAPRDRVVEPPPRVAPADWLPGSWPRAPDAFADERLGSLFAGVGNYDRALRHFAAAYEEDPRDRRVRLFLALFRAAGGKDAEARRLLDRVPASYLEEPEVHELAGRIALWASNPERALASFGRARELGASEPEASLDVARAALLAGDLDTARAELAPLAAAHPDRAEVSNLLAALEMKLGRPREAVAHLERSLEIDPAQRAVYGRLAELYAALGDRARADEMARRFAEGASEPP